MTSIGSYAARFKAWKAARVQFNPNVMGGEPTIVGTRLLVAVIADYVDAGQKDELLEDFPYLSSDDLEFASTFMKLVRTT